MKRFLALLFLLFASNSIRAQDEPPFFATASLFTDEVEIIESRPVYDNQARVLYMYYEGQWRSYPYPYNLPDIVRIYTLNDGTYLLQPDHSPDSPPPELWNFNPQTGNFMANPPHCGNLVGRSDPYRDVGWVYFDNLRTGQIYLCDASTGELSPPLPDWTTHWGRNGGIDVNHRQPSVSPNGDWVIFFGNGEQGRLVAAYHVPAREFVNLGSAEGSTTAYVQSWQSNTIAVLAVVYTGEMPSDYWRGYSFVDVTQENSLQAISGTNGWEVSIQYYDDPPRFEQQGYANELVDPSHEETDGPCLLAISYLDPFNAVQYELGNNCYNFVTLNYEHRYYLEAHPDAGALRALMWFNPQTNEISQVFAGEIEGLVGFFSPSGRYLLVIMDDDGVLDQANMSHPQLFVYDLETGEPVIQIDVPADQLRQGMNARWVTDLVFLLQPFANDLTHRPIRLIQLVDDGLMETSIDVSEYMPDTGGRWRVSENGQYMLIWMNQAEQIGGVLNLVTGERTVLTNATDPSEYRLNFDFQAENFSVRVTPPNAAWSVSYILRLAE